MEAAGPLAGGLPFLDSAAACCQFGSRAGLAEAISWPSVRFLFRPTGAEGVGPPLASETAGGKRLPETIGSSCAEVWLLGALRRGFWSPG